MRIAAVFSGQGAQAQGMGSELYASSEVARKIYDIAGEDIKRYSFHGSKEELSQTIITQPTVYTLSMAAYYSFFDHVTGAKPCEHEVVALAGFSLGEFSAYTAAGVFEAGRGKFEGFAEGLDIVRKRAEFMDKAGRGAHYGMAAVLGDPNSLNEAIKNAAENELLEAVNFNSPTQTAISGSLTAIERLKNIARGYRLKVIPLTVSTAFHSKVMVPASEKLAELIKSMDFRPPQIPIYMNMTGESLSAVTNAAEINDKDKEHTIKLDIKNYIANQVKSPVLWQKTIENIEKEIKPDVYIEFGPGSTLTGLIKKIVRETQVYNIETWEDILKYS